MQLSAAPQLVEGRAPRPLLLILTLPVWVGHYCPTLLTLILILTLTLILTLILLLTLAFDVDREGHGFSRAVKGQKK